MMENRTIDDMLDALEAVGTMDPCKQREYFDLRLPFCGSFEGLFMTIATCTADEIFAGVKRYKDDRKAEKNRVERERVQRLADQIGLNRLAVIVRELRGEGNA